jgi:alpha-1,2-mannosyltransferase
VKDLRLPRPAALAVYTVVLLWAGLEILRALGRVDGVVFLGYVQVGEAVLQGHAPYGGGLSIINTWPPFFLFIGAGLAWLARLSLLGMLFLWQVVGVLAIWGTLKLCARLYLPGGDRVTFWPCYADAYSFVSAGILVPFVMMARLFQEHVQHTQINVQVLFLVLLAFVWFRERHPAAGGLALALAASVKAVPVAFVAYLVYKRAWRETAWTLGFLVLLNLVLPAMVFGPGETASLWRRWREVSEAQVALATTAHFYNQSLLAALKRIAPSAGATLFPALAGLAAAGLAWAFRRNPRDLRDPTVAAELAVCLGALIVVDPLAWKAHYVTLIAAYCFAYQQLRRWPVETPGRRWRWGVWWGSFACLTLSAPAFVGERVNDALERGNVILVGALLVIALALSLMPPWRPLPSRTAEPSTG